MKNKLFKIVIYGYDFEGYTEKELIGIVNRRLHVAGQTGAHVRKFGYLLIDDYTDEHPFNQRGGHLWFDAQDYTKIDVQELYDEEHRRHLEQNEQNKQLLEVRERREYERLKMKFEGESDGTTM